MRRGSGGGEGGGGSNSWTDRLTTLWTRPSFSSLVFADFRLNAAEQACVRAITQISHRLLIRGATTGGRVSLQFPM